MSTLLFKNNLDGTTDVVSGGINTLKINADKTLATATPSNTMSGNNLATVGQIPSLVVTSISGLLAADTSKVVNVLNYHTGLEGGGGVFYWDAAKPATKHNGGTVISPLAVFPTDWNNQTQLAAWFAAPTTSGVGCWVRQYDGAVDVKWFGAKGDSITDDTAAIQGTINASAVTYVPGGATYRVDGTIQIGRKQLIIDGHLAKLSAYTADTGPVLHVTTNNARVEGVGRISSQKQTPNGVVLFGCRFDATESNNVLFSGIRGLRITGVKGANSIGVAIHSFQGFGAGRSEACYSCFFDSLFIESVDIGYKLTAQSNGHVITNTQFYDIGTTCYLLDGRGYDGLQSITDNVITGCFVHFSLSLDTIISIINGNRNCFYGINGEPGAGKFLTLDSVSNTNQIFGIDNCPDASSIGNVENVICRNLDFSTKNLTVTNIAAARAITYFGTGGTINSATNFLYDSNGNLLHGRTDNPNGVSGCIYSPGTYNATSGVSADVAINSYGLLIRATSSLKYKKEVEQYDKALDALMQLRGVYYRSKNELDPKQRFAGVIAEELHDAGMPEFVKYAEDGSPDGVAYGHMAALFIEAIKQLKNDFDAYKAAHP